MHCKITYGSQTFTLHAEEGEYIGGQVSKGSFYEADLLAAISALPLGEGVIVDVGANIGNHTVFFAGVMGHEVVAIEPAESNRRFLALNVEANNLSDHVTIHGSALWSEDAELWLRQRIQGNGGTWSASVEKVAGATHSVTATTLDAIVGEQDVELIKIDTEGAELAVLEGAASAIRRSHPFLVVELEGPHELGAVHARLAALGYRLLTLRGRTDTAIFAHESRGAATLQGMFRVWDDRGRQRRQEWVSSRIEGSLSKVNDGVNGLRLDRVRGVASSDPGVGDALRRDRDLALVAFREVSRRLQQETGGVWDSVEAEARITSMLGDPEHDAWDSEVPGVVRLPQPAVGRQPVRIGIASMPGREEALAEVVRTLSPQADEVMVYLNEMASVPDELPHLSNVRYFTGPDLGDRGKFLFLRGFEGYYLTCDDDINYPLSYVHSIVDGVERYGRRAIVGWHGSLILDGFSDYYDATSRRVMTFYSEQPDDIPVHILGTGIAGFHTSTMQLDFCDFAEPHMADVWLGLAAQRQNTPMVMLAHKKWQAHPIQTENSISTVSLGKQQADDRWENVRRDVTDVVTRAAPWRTHSAERVFVREPLKVAIIGRVNPRRWRRRGILESCHRIKDMLQVCGAQVTLYEITYWEQQADVPEDTSIAIIYCGDPQAPDFLNVDAAVAHCASRGVPVLVNVSVLGSRWRSDEARERIKGWQQAHGPAIGAFVFTDMARHLPGLEEIADDVVVLPKTLPWNASPGADFHSSEGVFVGDIGKLANEKVRDLDVDEWLSAIRDALPGVPLKAVEQYESKEGRDFGVDEVWPFMPTQELHERVSRCRLMVSSVQYLTFEMVPMEAAALGVPVVHLPMPHSLSDSLGTAAVQVATPQELRDVLPTLYHDPVIWRSVSEAGRHRGMGSNIPASLGRFYLELTKFARRHA